MSGRQNILFPSALKLIRKIAAEQQPEVTYLHSKSSLKSGNIVVKYEIKRDLTCAIAAFLKN
jgi:hypothetical protein